MSDLIVRDEETVRTIVLNRLEKKNSMTEEMILGVAEAVETASVENGQRVIVITGGPDCFSSGADLDAYVKFDARAAKASNLRTWMRMFDAIESCPLPVVASVAGPAIAGGTEMTLACDMVIAAESSIFGLVEARVGVIPGAGASVRLTRWVGRAHAKEILMLGDTFSAEEAWRIGLVNRLVPDAELEAETTKLAQRLASRSPVALAAAKRAVNIGGEMVLEHGMQYVLHEFSLLFDSDDQKEGMSAFLEKRKPNFTGT